MKQYQANITLESPEAGPLLAELIGRTLRAAGASVSCGPLSRATVSEDQGPVLPELHGLHVHFGRTVWVTREEAARWAEDRTEQQGDTAPALVGDLADVCKDREDLLVAIKTLLRDYTAPSNGGGHIPFIEVLIKRIEAKMGAHRAA